MNLAKQDFLPSKIKNIGLQSRTYEHIWMITYLNNMHQWIVAVLQKSLTKILQKQPKQRTITFYIVAIYSSRKYYPKT